MFIGPADLHASLGYPGETGNPAVVPMIEDAIRRIRKAGKAAGVLTAAEAEIPVATSQPAACTQPWGRMLASWPVALNSCWPNTADFGAGTLPVFSLAYAIGGLAPVSDGCNSVPSRRALGPESSREFGRF